MAEKIGVGVLGICVDADALNLRISLVAGQVMSGMCLAVFHLQCSFQCCE